MSPLSMCPATQRHILFSPSKSVTVPTSTPISLGSLVLPSDQLCPPPPPTKVPIPKSTSLSNAKTELSFLGMTLLAFSHLLEDDLYMHAFFPPVSGEHRTRDKNLPICSANSVRSHGGLRPSPPSLPYHHPFQE